MVDVELFGMRPALHHLISLLLHIANAGLLFIVLKHAAGVTWRAAGAAALFALHPLRVESVAWASERKDVLSAFFFLLTLLAYVKYSHATRPDSNIPEEQRQAGRYYVLALVAFAAALLSKPMVVTLPFVLLLLDVWPLNRIQVPKPGTKPLSGLKPLALEKVPFFALALFSSIITYEVQRGSYSVSVALPFGVRLANTVTSYVGYLKKSVWPVDLAIFYPHPAIGSRGFPWPWWELALGGLLLVIITIACLWLWRAKPWLPVGWFWFLGTLVPVIGLIQVGAQAMADRYTYIPSIGLSIMVAWGFWTVGQQLRFPHVTLRLAAGAALIALGVMTYRQTGLWRDDFTIFSHTLKVTTRNALAHSRVGSGYAERGDYDLALDTSMKQSGRTQTMLTPTTNSVTSSSCNRNTSWRSDRIKSRCGCARRTSAFTFARAWFWRSSATARKPWMPMKPPSGFVRITAMRMWQWEDSLRLLETCPVLSDISCKPFDSAPPTQAPWRSSRQCFTSRTNSSTPKAAIAEF
jgi:hypothetical protein